MYKNPILCIYKIIILLFSLSTIQAFAEDLRIKINSGQVEPLQIAIANFTGDEGRSSKIGMQISSVVSNNLVSSGQFKAIYIDFIAAGDRHRQLMQRERQHRCLIKRFRCG